jgi:hypothetical protein
MEIAGSMGIRIRRARLRAGRTQAEVGEMIGVSQSMISRLELGRGAGMPLETWILVADAVGIDVFTPDDPGEPFGATAVLAYAQDGGWSPVSRDRQVIVLDRPQRRVPRPFRGRLLPGERVVVSVVDVVTDVAALIDRSMAAAANTRIDLPDGWSIGELVVVRRTAANRRRLTESRHRLDAAFPDSGSRWIGTLRDSDSTMPIRSGLLWLDAQGIRLIPTRLRLRRA